jgi:3-hydroxyacyl-CoA dehydrogenase/enoyl-CoA hydratase/3-hydroxybutyryl-CoA epimerase
MAKNYSVNVDAEGIATILLDAPGRPMNVITSELVRELSGDVARLATDANVRGVVITSAKESFIPGFDLTELVQQFERYRSAAEAYSHDDVGLSKLYSRIETCGKPFAAAINGLALGGGLELALACHYRVLANDPKAVVGFPEVKVGLLPGAGGTQRLPRLIGIEKALPILVEGNNVKPEDALKLGIVHELAPRAEVVAAARRWLLGKPTAQQPWDQKGFRVPGGANPALPNVMMTFGMGSAMVAKATLHNYPAPPAILSAVFEGVQLPIDRGLAVEGKYFAKLLTSAVARNLIRTMFINKGKADKLARRPQGVPKTEVKKLGILGAGMMGSGIAYVSAQAGMQVVLLDSTLELAERGKSYSANLLKKDIERGRTTQEKADALLARIRTTTDYAHLEGCDLVIEAVFESREIKADVTRKTEAVTPKGSVFASNTSTLPITGLAEASRRPKQFIGIHFFSPVDKMPLVEVIMGKKTSQETLARALDYIGQIRKTPIVVNDSRGFYTSRVFGTYCSEGQKMLAEGVEPALIENAGRMAGMPVGPLAVSDEVSIELQYKVMKQTRADLGEKYQPGVADEVMRHFVEDLKRLGRKSGGGFYEYPKEGRKYLWPGLRSEYPPATKQPTLEEVKRRLLYIQALETARCFEEGVLTSAAEADLGSILGWGFPAWTGGTLSFIDTIGVAQFVADCRKLAKLHGPRFKPSRGLLARAKRNEPFHASAAQPPAAEERAA